MLITERSRMEAAAERKILFIGRAPWARGDIHLDIIKPYRIIDGRGLDQSESLSFEFPRGPCNIFLSFFR
jgi:hypothetical protein